MIDWTQMRTADQIAAEAQAELRARIVAAIDARVETQARALGYNSAATLASYVASTTPDWAREAQAFVAWRDAVWLAAFQHDEVVAGGKAPATAEAALAALPEWGAQ